VLAITREMELDPTELNLNGGVVALRHPIGAAGSSILTTFLSAVEVNGLRQSLASVCVCVWVGGRRAFVVEPQ
jgi:acetyl-CoA C-acetyltransferase